MYLRSCWWHIDALLPAVRERSDPGEARRPDVSAEDRAGGAEVLSAGLSLCVGSASV